MKRIITNETKSVAEKRDSSLEPQKSTLDFLMNFARVYHVTNVKQVKNQSLILN